MATLQRSLSKSGKYYTFSIPGVRGQLHIAPKMVQGSCPASIEVTGIEFASPSTATVDPAVALAAVEKASKALAKQEERLAKARAKLAQANGVPETPAVDPVAGTEDAEPVDGDQPDGE